MAHRKKPGDGAGAASRDELDAYYLGPAEFQGPDELLERLCAAAIKRAEIEEKPSGAALKAGYGSSSIRSGDLKRFAKP